MTRERFRQLAQAAVDHIANLPDDLWDGIYPMITLGTGAEEVVVGIREKEEGGEDDG